MTTTVASTIKSVLDDSNPNNLAAVLQKVALGTMLEAMLAVVTETITISSADNVVLSVSSAAARAALMVQAVDVVTGTAAGTRVVGPSGADLSTTECTLSDDGDTITFEAVCTVIKIRWIPMPVAPTWTEDFAIVGLAS